MKAAEVGEPDSWDSTVFTNKEGFFWIVQNHTNNTMWEGIEYAPPKKFQQ